MKYAVVIKNHQSTDPDLLSAKAGDILQGEEKSTFLPNWFWCHDKKGVYSWVPKTFLEAIHDQPGYFKLIKDYIAHELTVKVGDELNILSEDCDWAFAKTQNGEEGWVPLENLEF
ncbi:MAG: hypothetical protein FK733_00565 [Asgard group archaeon]|nr:hypothetical protein [Asgard group archaeon]